MNKRPAPNVLLFFPFRVSFTPWRSYVSCDGGDRIHGGYLASRIATKKKILAVDCCEHILSALNDALNIGIEELNARDRLDSLPWSGKVGLILFGFSNPAVRQQLIGRLRRFFPDVAVLILSRSTEDETGADFFRGEFILGDIPNRDDLEMVEALRRILPIELPGHREQHGSDEIVKRAARFVSEEYADPYLDLGQTAERLQLSPAALSRALNKQAGLSFRQLLRQTRIQAAKRMLTSGRYSVKEVAARTGFSDSHYFSRVFKEVTGLNASQYEIGPDELIFA